MCHNCLFCEKFGDAKIFSSTPQLASHYNTAKCIARQLIIIDILSSVEPLKKRLDDVPLIIAKSQYKKRNLII